MRPELRSALDACIAELGAGEELVCDLSEVPYIDSTGIGVLVGAAHRCAEAGGALVVARPQRNVPPACWGFSASARTSIFARSNEGPVRPLSMAREAGGFISVFGIGGD